MIQFGDEGSTVKLLQQKLKESGYEISTDGIFGKGTLSALKDYQGKNGLVADGIAGEKTLKAMGLLNSKRPLLWYPGAIRYPKAMRTHGVYEQGWPVGAIIHFTAGAFGSIKEAENTIEDGIKKGYGYDCIASTGEIIQARPVNEKTYHAGESAWPGIGHNVSNKLIGIEICNAGKLTKKADGTFVSWFGKTIPANQVRETTKNYQGVPGYYHAYTPQQEASLIKYLVWLKLQNPDVFQTKYILGHDMVAGVEGIGYARKNDPGGALSLPVREFQQLIEEEYLLQSQK